jgi:hypothetical protein
VKSIDGAMINTIAKSGEDEACVKLAREWVARCQLMEAYHDHKRYAAPFALRGHVDTFCSIRHPSSFPRRLA